MVTKTTIYYSNLFNSRGSSTSTAVFLIRQIPVLLSKDEYANLKYKYGNRHFWCRGYYVDTVGKYETAIRQYIRNQLQEDISNDQISMKELFDPFTGEPEK